MNADQYQEQWSTLTGRSASAVYVPEAIRSFELVEGARVAAGPGDMTGTVLSVASTGLARVKWDDGPISHERIDENGVCQ